MRYCLASNYSIKCIFSPLLKHKLYRNIKWTKMWFFWYFRKLPCLFYWLNAQKSDTHQKSIKPKVLKWMNGRLSFTVSWWPMPGWKQYSWILNRSHRKPITNYAVQGLLNVAINSGFGHSLISFQISRCARMFHLVHREDIETVEQTLTLLH